MAHTNSKRQRTRSEALLKPRKQQNSQKKPSPRLQSGNVALTTADISNLKNQVYDLQSRLNRSYTEDPLTETEPVAEDEIVLTGGALLDYTGTHSELKAHSEKLEQWNTNLKETKAKFNDYVALNRLKQTALNDAEPTLLSAVWQEDEKEDSDMKMSEMSTGGDACNEVPVDSKILLRQTRNLSNLTTMHHARTAIIPEFIVPLNEMRADLKKKVKKCQQAVPETESQQKEAIEKERTELRSQIQLLMQELNRVIQAENRMKARAARLEYERKMLEVEVSSFQQLLDGNNSVLQAYKECAKEIKATCGTVNDYVTKQWQIQESVWTQWNGEDIVNYLHYLNFAECDRKIKLSNQVDLEEVRKQVISAQINGRMLPKMTEGRWRDVGVEVLEDRMQIDERIQELMRKYPLRGCKDDDVEIPAQFKCPLSGKLMRDAVIAPNNVTYDRQNIELYVAEYNRFPHTEEELECDADDVLYFDNIGLQTEIEMFVAQHPQFRYVQ